jgi:hypothetical protein
VSSSTSLPVRLELVRTIHLLLGTTAATTWHYWHNHPTNVAAWRASGLEAKYGRLSDISYETFFYSPEVQGTAPDDATWQGVGYVEAPPAYIVGGLGRFGLGTKSSTGANDMEIGQSHVIYSVPYGTGQYDSGIIDLTDGAGHGIIFAGQNLYLTNSPTTTNGSNAGESFKARILYRWKNVSLTEYIGVVTSQLSA